MASQRHLTGPGWEGDAPEYEWANGIFEAVGTKTKKLLDHYERYGEDWLLVYDNLHLPGVDLDQAGGLLRSYLARCWDGGAFNVVAIESQGEIVLVDGESIRRFPVRDFWRGTAASGQPE